MPEKILITGALGFLGRHVARAAAKAGHHVVGIGRGQWSEAFGREWGFAEGRAWPITTETLDTIGTDAQLILHCAGSGSLIASTQNPLVSLEDNVTTAASVLEYARLRGGKVKVVLVSGAAIYGEGGSAAIEESQSTRPISVYGNHKALAEDLARWYGREYRLPIAIVRPFVMYGVGQRKGFVWELCEKLIGGAELSGTGEETCDLISVEDIAAWLPEVAKAASPLCPIYNAGSGQSIRVQDLAELLAKMLAVKAPKFSGIADRGQPKAAVANIERARASGFKTTKDWQKGMAEFAAWFLSESAGRRAA